MLTMRKATAIASTLLVFPAIVFSQAVSTAMAAHEPLQEEDGRLVPRDKGTPQGLGYAEGLAAKLEKSSVSLFLKRSRTMLQKLCRGQAYQNALCLLRATRSNKCQVE